MRGVELRVLGELRGESGGMRGVELLRWAQKETGVTACL